MNIKLITFISLASLLGFSGLFAHMDDVRMDQMSPRQGCATCPPRQGCSTCPMKNDAMMMDQSRMDERMERRMDRRENRMERRMERRENRMDQTNPDMSNPNQMNKYQDSQSASTTSMDMSDEDDE